MPLESVLCLNSEHAQDRIGCVRASTLDPSIEWFGEVFLIFSIAIYWYTDNSG